MATENYRADLLEIKTKTVELCLALAWAVTEPDGEALMPAFLQMKAVLHALNEAEQKLPGAEPK